MLAAVAIGQNDDAKTGGIEVAWHPAQFMGPPVDLDGVRCIADENPIPLLLACPRVADLLAIISRDRARPLAPEQLDALTKTYETLRGAATRCETAAARWVQARTLERAPAGTAGIEESEDGWTIWAGGRPRPGTGMTGPLDELDGQFALIRVAGDDSIMVAADPLGMKPLFVASSKGTIFVSTSALVLARYLHASPSRLGLESFLRSGLQFGRWTQWEGIERLRPAERREYTPAGSSDSIYWQPAVEPDLGELSLGEAAELCIARATSSIASRYAGCRPWIDLTGGFDSRLLALLARRAGVDFTANTFGGDDDLDVRLAGRVASAAGWAWRSIDLPADWAERMPELVAEALAWGDGHLDALQLAGVMFGHRQKAESETTLLNGGGGEELRDHPWSHELLGAGRSTRVDYGRLIAWRILLAVDLSALRRDPTAAVRDAFRAELEERAQPFSSLPNTAQDDILYAYKMTGHSGAYQAAAGACIDLEMPFYLRDVLLSAISVAPRHRRFHRLMREMMRQLDPALAAIPTETGGPAEPLSPRNLHRFAPYAWRRGRRFATRLHGRVPRLPGAAKAGAPSAPEAAQGALVARLRQAGRLDPMQMRSAALYDPARLGELLDRAVRRPGSVDWTAIGRIVTVELALEAADSGLG